MTFWNEPHPWLRYGLNTVVDVLIKLEIPQVLTTDFFVEVMGRDAYCTKCRYWCRSRRNFIPEEDLGLDRLLESYKKVKHLENHQV
jgi:hypothetical protein